MYLFLWSRHVSSSLTPIIDIFKVKSEKSQCLPRGLELLVKVRGPTSSLDDPISVGHVSISGKISSRQEFYGALCLQFISLSTVVRVEEQVDRFLSSDAPIDALVIFCLSEFIKHRKTSFNSRNPNRWLCLTRSNRTRTRCLLQKGSVLSWRKGMFNKIL